MSLARKTLALFLLLGVCLWIGSYAILKTAVFPAFEEFERDSSEQALTRVMRILEEDLRAIDIMNIEYSVWSQTYEYALGERPEYETENLDPAYWHSIDINLFAVYDAKGQELFSWIADADGRVKTFREEAGVVLEPDHALISLDEIDDVVQGFLRLDSGIMQLVSRPILTSEGEGPIAGTFIVGQALTPKRLADLSERATVDILIQPIDKQSATSTTVAGGGDMFMLARKDVTQTMQGTIHSHATLVDLFGAPIAVLKTSLPRRIAEIGTSVVNTAMLALGLASAAFLMAGLYLLHALVTKPVNQLTGQILSIRESGDLSVEVDEGRTDEVGMLAKEFSLLTKRLSSARAELEQARDEALAMSKTKSEFLARMSHEIRTPMNGILGMTELLRETKLDNKQMQFAGTIYESGESLLHIINDILDISKIEAGKIELDVAPFNLQNVIEECLELLAESAHRKGLELACNIPLDVNVNVRGDPVRLRQILLNLIGNALKFTEHGEVIVRLSQQYGGAGEGRYRFEIEDTGIGISAENQKTIFEAFVQEDGSNTRRYGGTGLGLAISKQLVELMGGTIGMKSQQGRGSLFWFEMALAPDAPLTAKKQPRLLSGSSVLIVDDNATNREILQHQLEGWGARVTVARSGYEAMSILTDAPEPRLQLDVMLFDVAMPGMDGLELATAVKNDNRYRHVPIIMLSSISRSNVNESDKLSVPDEWLAKPVRQSRLYDSLLSVMNREHVGQEATKQPAAEKTLDNKAENDGENVLLVDDNDVNLAVAREMLGSLGHNVTIARNGVEAVESAKEQRFDAILMDCHMPELDGFEATREIREFERNQGHESTPIIAQTAHALPGDRERCIAAGMTDYLSKPFTKRQLQKVLSAPGQDNLVSAPGYEGVMGEKTAEEQSSDSIGCKGRVLVVDDNEVNRQVARSMLRSIGYEPQCAIDGDKALAAMAVKDFDLILMDCHMPVRDGYETTREIRRLEEIAASSKHTPIVAVTADFLESNRQLCLEAGMDDYLMKPFTQEQLRAVTNRWLCGRAANDSTIVQVDEDGFSKLGDTQTLACIDREIFNEITALGSSEGGAVLREIVVSYCATSTKNMLQLRAAVVDEDLGLIEMIAHSLKGGSGQIGATFLATLCEEMIRATKCADMERMSALLERAAMEHSAVITALDVETQTDAA